MGGPLLSASRWGLVVCAIMVCSAQVSAETARELAGRLLSQDGVRAGLCIHVGCGDGTLTLALHRDGRYLVHGTSAKPERVAQARDVIRAAGIYGSVSVDLASMKRLPYRPGIANVVVVDDFTARQQEGLTAAEVVRVLAPYGSAFLRGGPTKVSGVSVEPLGGGWVRLRKPYPDAMDEWTHFEHDAARTSVSSDRLVKAPTSMRWTGGRWWPDWTYGSSGATGFASAGGRNFYQYVELSSAKSSLDCRDSFNGLLLWRKAIGRTAKPVVLVAAGDRVYAHKGGPGGLVALDAVTGKEIVQYEESSDAHSADLLYSDGVLVHSAAGVRAFDTASGRLLWQKANGLAAVDAILIGDGRAIYLHRDAKDEPLHLVSCDLRTGREHWRKDVQALKHVNSHSLILYHNDMIILGSSSRLLDREHDGVNVSGTYAISARDGSLLWTYEYDTTPHFGTATSVLHLDNLIWVKRKGADDKNRYVWAGLDPQTGSEKKRVVSPYNRCYPDRALSDRILAGEVDFLDPETGKLKATKAARGDCVAGFIPANGLTYIFPQRCHCANYLHGMMAFSSDPAPAPESGASRAGIRFEKGPAFGAVSAPAASPDDWPMHRHDALRSGGTRAAVPAELKVLWDAPVGGGASSPVVVGGRVFVASVDEHRVVCLDAAAGTTVWSFIAGGRIDSPPTVHKGLALFGCADGWVYCLRAADGELVWRFRAAPADERIVADGQIESAWPVHGSVLVTGDTAYFAAGRHTYLDGGLHCYAADPPTGRILWQQRVGREAGENLCDVLVSDGQAIRMGQRIAFDPETGKSDRSAFGREVLFMLSGLLEDNAIFPGEHYNYRQMVYGRVHFRAEPRGYVTYSVRGGCWYGKLLAFDKEGIFGSGYVGYWNPGRYAWEVFGYPSRSAETGTSTGSYPSSIRIKPQWAVPLSVEVRQGPTRTDKPQRTQAVLLAGETLFAAHNAADGEGGELWALSRADGRKLGELALPAAPRWDGMAAVPGRLFVSTQDGRVLCLGEK